ncbi:DUF6146 family protein [Flavobacterium sp. RHBU_3]|uniref:DUF6146 family protein n=1 Tax=Flavobacterium sp. RHBU_3 TaxID=3391184 RepID=UPI00398478AF
MKAFIITIAAFALLVLPGCGSKNATAVRSIPAADIKGNETAQVASNAAPQKNDTVRIANDSLEYEVIIIDPGFNNWLYSRAKPRGFYGEPYLRNHNLQWVNEWNMRVMQPQRYGDMYQMRIDYDGHTKYGYEVNYLLYNYLVYFQINNNQRLGGLVPRD